MTEKDRSLFTNLKQVLNNTNNLVYNKKKVNSQKVLPIHCTAFHDVMISARKKHSQHKASLDN